MYLIALCSKCLEWISYILGSYDELWQWSVDHYDTFWEEFFHFSNVKYSVPYDEV